MQLRPLCTEMTIHVPFREVLESTLSVCVNQDANTLKTNKKKVCFLFLFNEVK